MNSERIARARSNLLVLAPGPINRGVELSGTLLDDPRVSLVEEQVRNGVPTRMALLYLMAASESATEASLVSSSS